MNIEWWLLFFSSERSSLHYFPPLSNATVSQQSASGQIEVTFLHCVFFSDMCQSTGWPATSSSSTPSYTLVPTSQTLVLTIITFMITTLHYIINDHAFCTLPIIYTEKPHWKWVLKSHAGRQVATQQCSRDEGHQCIVVKFTWNHLERPISRKQ